MLPGEEAESHTDEVASRGSHRELGMSRVSVAAFLLALASGQRAWSRDLQPGDPGLHHGVLQVTQ